MNEGQDINTHSPFLKDHVSFFIFLILIDLSCFGFYLENTGA